MSREYPKLPMVGIGVVVWREWQVLLIRRGKPPRIGQWSLPGGLQELGETVFEGGRREVREETGTDVEITGLLDVIDSIQHDPAGRVRFHYTLVDLAAEWLSGEPVAGDDAAAAAWADADDLERYQLWDETVRLINLSAAKRKPL
jgi:ADP-ribose pyrophosphatase YjhB (NUDIX family)